MRRATPKPLGHTQDLREHVATRAAIAAADLQAAWDSSLFSGPVAAILAAQVPVDERTEACRPPPLQRKARKTSHPFGRTSGNKPARRKDALVPQLDATLNHIPLLATPKWLLPPVKSAPMMCAISTFGQAGCLEPPKGSSLAATSVIT